MLTSSLFVSKSGRLCTFFILGDYSVYCNWAGHIVLFDVACSNSCHLDSILFFGSLPWLKYWAESSQTCNVRRLLFSLRCLCTNLTILNLFPLLFCWCSSLLLNASFTQHWKSGYIKSGPVHGDYYST